MNSKANVFMLFLIGSIAVGSAACSKVGFSQAAPLESANDVTGDDNGPGDSTPVDPNVVKTTCQNKTNVSKVYTVEFPKPDVCAFNTDGNLGLRDQYFQARREQVVGFDLPANSVLCNMSFSFSRQTFRYDDYFAVAFNNAVIASGFDFGPYLEKSNGLQMWDWSRVAGKAWAMSSEAEYCAGKDAGLASCSWPKTQTVGDITLSVHQSIFQKITAMDIKRTHHEFRMITTGDNDPAIDCIHEPIKFDVKVDYVQ